MVAQLVRALACHARGRGFEPHPSRHSQTNMPRGFSSFGRAPPCQGGGGGFEPRTPLQKKASRKTCFFLSNPKDWYGITRRVYGIRRKATAWHHATACIFLRIDAIHGSAVIPYRRYAADSIHAFGVIYLFTPNFAILLLTPNPQSVIILPECFHGGAYDELAW